MTAEKDWWQRELDEATKFLAWIDALNVESLRQGRGIVWPDSNKQLANSKTWLARFDCGLTPKQALAVRDGPPSQRSPMSCE